MLISKSQIVFVAFSLVFATFFAWWIVERSRPSRVEPHAGLANREIEQRTESEDQQSKLDFDSDQAIAIPFKMTESGNASIPVLLNGKDELVLMLHTAVDSIYVTQDALAKRTSIKISEKTRVESWGGQAEVDRSTGNSIAIGGLVFDDQTIWIDSLSGEGTDGKFGLNLFGNRVVEINFDRREIVLRSTVHQEVLRAGSGYRHEKLTEKAGSFYVDAKLKVDGGELSHSFMIHSGFTGSLLLDDEFVKANGLDGKLKVISQRELRDSLGNTIVTKKVQIDGLQLGGVDLPELAVEIFDGSIGRQRVSVLGMEVLSRFNMVLDAANRDLYLAPNSHESAARPG